MREIRRLLSGYLKTLHPNVYFQVAPEKALFPYIVYDLPVNLDDGEYSQQITIDIDGWDLNNTGDTEIIEDLMATINGEIDENGKPSGLNKKTLSSDLISITFYLDNEMALQDPNKDIKRRKYIYSGKLIRRN